MYDTLANWPLDLTCVDLDLEFLQFDFQNIKSPQIVELVETDRNPSRALAPR